jgi:ribosomal protein S18 acetylase RimI-like enzyme
MVRLDVLCFAEPFRFDVAMMRDFAEADDSIVVLVEDNTGADLIGFVILHLEKAATVLLGYIVTIDVAESCRRLGIGAALLRRAEKAAQAAGASHVDLHVAVDNAGAIRFYEGQHYKRVGLEKCFYRQAGLDALVYTKLLPR